MKGLGDVRRWAGSTIAARVCRGAAVRPRRIAAALPHDALTLFGRGVLALLVVIACTGTAWAQPSRPVYAPPPGKAAAERVPILREVGIDQKLDQQVPLDLPFTDETGKDVRLGDYFTTRPVLLALVYYECPMLCTQVLNGLVGSLSGITFDVGKDFDLVVVSFDPGETPALAAERRKFFLKRYARPGADASVHFLTGREAPIAQLTSAVGFRYAYDAGTDQFAHPAAITILTPAGRVSRYLFGIEFAPRDLRLALVEAAGNQIGTMVDQALLFCYHYDPESGKYGLMIMNLIRLAGILTVGGLGAFVFLTLRRERRQDTAVGTTATGTR
jgi:protein SCO1